MRSSTRVVFLLVGGCGLRTLQPPSRSSSGRASPAIAPGPGLLLSPQAWKGASLHQLGQLGAGAGHSHRGQAIRQLQTAQQAWRGRPAGAGINRTGQRIWVVAKPAGRGRGIRQPLRDIGRAWQRTPTAMAFAGGVVGVHCGCQAQRGPRGQRPAAGPIEEGLSRGPLFKRNTRRPVARTHSSREVFHRQSALAQSCSFII